MSLFYNQNAKQNITCNTTYPGSTPAIQPIFVIILDLQVPGILYCHQVTLNITFKQPITIVKYRFPGYYFLYVFLYILKIIDLHEI